MQLFDKEEEMLILKGLNTPQLYKKRETVKRQIERCQTLINQTSKSYSKYKNVLDLDAQHNFRMFINSVEYRKNILTKRYELINEYIIEQLKDNNNDDNFIEHKDKRCRSIVRIDKDGKFTKYDSISAAAASVNGDPKLIQKYLKGMTKLEPYGFYWEYEDIYKTMEGK